jgi:hypothetical protein
MNTVVQCAKDVLTEDAPAISPILYVLNANWSECAAG